MDADDGAAAANGSAAAADSAASAPLAAPSSLPEVELYAYLLTLMLLIDNKQYEQVGGWVGAGVGAELHGLEREEAGKGFARCGQPKLCSLLAHYMRGTGSKCLSKPLCRC